ncbi:translation initiation factor IF-2-like [Panicum virgatum]|uniref:translation initiation factor IF-2-like n=1 Tax=Panicum virgatum TaxID=38727 RepID=UPI0019D68014|nr:translation initiation factor IF-2-like [Panicum virgatum]
MHPGEGYIQLGLTHNGYVSDPPLPEIRTANRLRAEAEKRRKDKEKATREGKRKRKEDHERENKRREREGLSPQTTPESTPEQYSSSSTGVDFSESEDLDTEVAEGPPLVQQRAGVEASALATVEKGPAPAMMEKTPAPRAGRRLPAPAVGRRLCTPAADARSPMPTVGRRSPMPTVGRRVPAMPASATAVGKTTPAPAVTAVGESTPAPTTAGVGTLGRPPPPRVQPGAGDDAGRGGVEDAAQLGAGGEETSGDASECPISQTEGEVPAPEPARAGDEGAAAAAMVQTAPVVVPVVEVPAEETPEAGAPGHLEDPWEVAAAAAVPGAMLVADMPVEDPWEVAVMAVSIVSASEGGLGAGPSEEPEREGSWAMVQPGIPLVFDHNERWEYKAWGEHYKVNDEIHNALTLALDLHQGRSLQVSDLKQMSRDKSNELAQQYTRELAQARHERDSQRAAAERKAQEVEAQATELRQNAVVQEQKDKVLEAKEAELQGKEMAVMTLTDVLVHKDVGLEAQGATLHNAEASLSALLEQADAARA